MFARGIVNRTPPRASTVGPSLLLGGAVLLFLPLGSLAGSPPPMSWEAIAVNTADLPGRCGPERTTVSEQSHGVYGHSGAAGASPTVDSQIQGLLRDDVRKNPRPLHYFIKSSDYYRHREEIQRKIESAIAGLAADADKPRAYGNYAMSLAYLGEFKKVAAFFDSKGGAYDAAQSDGDVDFALAQALYRLGEFKPSLEHAERAHKRIEGAALDTRWQVMLSASGALGPKFFETKSDIYTTDVARKLFPEKTWTLPFEDVTDRMGLDRWGGFGSALFVDLDGDAWDDMVFEKKFFPLEVYKNLRGEAFGRVPEEELGVKPVCNAVLSSPGDFNNDGRPDLFRNCCNFDGKGPPLLMKNMGLMSFKEVAGKAGLGPVAGGTAACWGDLDLDGNLDLVVNYFGAESRIYRNNGDDTFTDASKRLGDGTRRSALGCTVGDLNGDRWPDIFLQGWGWRRLYLNEGDGAFKDATAASGIGDGSESQGYMASLFDYDNDGKMDILAGSYVVSSGEQMGISPICTCANLLSPEGFSAREWKTATTIFRNNGGGRFTNMRDKTRFMPLGAMSFAHADWDNSGREGVVLGLGGVYIQQTEPFLFYQNNGDGTFSNKTPFLMRSLWGKGHGLAFGDYDHDGHLDLLIQNGGAFPGDLWPGFLLHNTGNDNHWLNVSLKAGPGTNSSAIGAEVRVFAGKLRQVKPLQSGGNFSVSSLSLHFGLAKNKKVDKIIVHWPNRKRAVTVIENVEVDQAIEISETGGTYRRLWAPDGTAQSLKVKAR